MQQLLTLPPKDFLSEMLKLSMRRGVFTTRDHGLISSDSKLDWLLNWIQDSRDYHEHEGIFFEVDGEMNCSYFAFVHNTCRGAGQGGTRYNTYKTLADLMTDGLRLAEGMTYKSALAHLWWGGGKGIIDDPKGISNRSSEERAKIMARYGKFVASLNGCYVTAEDMNTNIEDMRIIHANCRHCTCIPVEIGGSGNPSPFSALGIQKAMEAAVHFLEGKESGLSGKHVAVQGAGNVGGSLIKNLVKAGAKVTAADVRSETRQNLRNRFSSAEVTVLEPESENDSAYANRILEAECDILSPNAVGAILNQETIPRIKAKIVCGAANNQLKDPVLDSEALQKRGILFLPDYVINRMGIVNCANEMYGYLKEDIEKAIEQLYPDTTHILEQAKKEDITPFAYADVWAKEEAQNPHPIWGHRGIRIIKELIEKKWEQGV